ncbi:CoxG family protein [Brevirhabdus sp.]|uniref:CoxG family protein n=1 Tax=Brevirhabdus sp. TaxID=2004514 RepID=UPI004059D7D9
MRFDGSALIPAPPDAVWRGLNDPEVLRRAIPGCQSMEQTGKDEFTGIVALRAGPVSATFRGKVALTEMDPPHTCTLIGRGQGGAAGFAKGQARITLTPEGEGTRLDYAAETEMGGKIASVGSRLIQGMVERIATDFFARLSQVLTDPQEGTDAGEAAAGGSGTSLPRHGAALPAAAQHSGHIPLIDRAAWLCVGLAIGIGIGLWAA